MKHSLVFVFLSLFLYSCATTGPSAPQSHKGFVLKQQFEPYPGMQIFEYEHTQSGLKVFLNERRESNVIAYVTAYDVGSRFEQSGRTGLAHLFEHMMFRGTPNYPAPFKTLSGWGDRFNAYTSFDITLYHQLVPKEVFKDVAKFEAERMRKLQITQDGFNTERGAVVSERKMRTEDSPGGRLRWELNQIAFDSHPYQTGPIGWQEDLDATTLEDALEFYKRYYAPNRAVVSLVGDFKIKEALDVLAAEYGSFQREKWVEPIVPAEKLDREDRRQVIPYQTESVFLADARFAPGLMNSQNPAEILLCTLLGDSTLGFLSSELVEKKIARSVRDSCYFLVDPSLSTITVVGNPGVGVAKLEKAYDAAMKKFPEWLNQDRLEGIKLYYLEYSLGQLREPMQIAESLAFNQVTAKDPMFGMKFMDQIKGVTLDQVKAVWEEWQSRAKTRVILKPAKRSAPFKRKVSKKAN